MTIHFLKKGQATLFGNGTSTLNLPECNKTWLTIDTSHAGVPHDVSCSTKFFCLPPSGAPQRVISVLPCGAGAALSLHLAAHLHSCAASQHAGCQLLPHTISHRRAGSLLTTAAGASYRGGQSDIMLVKRIRYTPPFFNLHPCTSACRCVAANLPVTHCEILSGQPSSLLLTLVSRC